ncbi:MAG: GNAT family N-acetyltransferase [Actinomycetota bacterium]
MGDLVVRVAVPEDADDIAIVHIESWQVGYRGLIPDDYLDSLSIDKRQHVWRQWLRVEGRDETNWVAERDGRVIGFAGAGASRDDDALSGTGEVFAIYVHGDHWGSGAGAGLMNAATGYLRERFVRGTLWVLDTNERARRFYERGGWAPDGATKDDDRGSFVLHEVRYRIDF